ARADLHSGADDGVGAHLDARVQLGAAVHDGGGMDARCGCQCHSFGLSAMVAIISASLASWPSTLASPPSLQMGPLRRCKVTCRSRRSPGTTMRRNFTPSKDIR